MPNRLLPVVLVLALSACDKAAGPVALPSPSASCVAPQKLAQFAANGFEWRLTFSPDGNLAMWGRGSTFFPRSRQSEIVYAERNGDSWTQPQVAEFSKQWSNIDPVFAPDGKTLFFSSIRAVKGVNRKDVDLWKVQREATGWSEPVHLGPLVNSPGDELYPSVDAAGNLYFASDGPSGQFDIYRSKPGPNGTYGKPEPLGPNINRAGAWEFNPEIAPDGKTLVFTAQGRPEGAGQGDLFIAELSGSDFGAPRSLGPCVNTSRDEYHPTMRWSTNELIFVRDGDFLQVAVQR